MIYCSKCPAQFVGLIMKALNAGWVRLLIGGKMCIICPACNKLEAIKVEEPRSRRGRHTANPA